MYVLCVCHYGDVIMGAKASQIPSLTTVYSTVYSGADQRKHQSSASLASVRGIHRWPVNSPHKGPLSRKILPIDDVIMCIVCMRTCVRCTIRLVKLCWQKVKIILSMRRSCTNFSGISLVAITIAPWAHGKYDLVYHTIIRGDPLLTKIIWH